MKTLKLFVLIAALCGLVCFSLPQKVSAADAPTAPTLVLNVYLQQAKIRINEPIKGSLTVSNPSDLKVDSFTLKVILPDAITLKQADCKTDFDVSSFTVQNFAGRKVKSWDVCYKLDAANAHAGTYAINYTITYQWSANQAVLTTEKAVEIDLIGVQSVFGIPIAFAGFVLPGLMILILLKIFKSPWAVNQSSEERLIIGVLFSAVLMWVISALAAKWTNVQWLQKFNLNDEVSLEKLILFILSGIVVGFIVVILYKLSVLAVNWWKRNQLIKSTDSNKQLVRKALMLNKSYSKKKVVFYNKKEGYRVVGTHFVTVDTNYLVFPQFRLTVDEISDAETKKDVIAFLDQHKSGEGDYSAICTDRGKIIKLMDKIMDDNGNSLVINKSVSIVNAGNTKEDPVKTGRLYEIKKDEFIIDTTDDSELAIITIYG